MKKRIAKLACLWLAVIMFATTAFAADIYVTVYTGDETLENGDEGLATESVFLSSESDSFKLNVDEVKAVLDLTDRDVTGWKVWDSVSGMVEGTPAEYALDDEVAFENLDGKVVEPIYQTVTPPPQFVYEITHQPTTNEPYVETNADDEVLTYIWYQISDIDIPLNDEDEYKLSKGENGEKYYCVIKFEDGVTELISDSFEWKKTVKRPTGGGMPAGGDMSTTGADKYDENDQKKPADSTPTVPTTPEAPSGEQDSGKLFDDVPENSWFGPAAEWMGQKGYMSGTAARTFSPNLNTTRGMIVTVLWRMAGSPAPQGECPFEDVKADSYYEDAITWAQENGVVTGYSDTIFKPDQLITREQLAAIIFRNEVRKGMEALTMEENLTHFEDADKISEYAVTAMNWAVGQKIINGVSETLLAPQKTATRAECATMLYRMENK